MFREMKRKAQTLSGEECEKILERGSSGVLALTGDEDYPYALPMSYVYGGGKIFFHSANSGHKIDAIKKSGKASFCVIDRDEVIPRQYTTNYRSVVAFGRVQIIKDRSAKRNAIEKLAVKYFPEDSPLNRGRIIEREWERFCMLEMTVEHLGGKQSANLVKKTDDKDFTPHDN